MRNRHANLSDMEQARQISQRLTGDVQTTNARPAAAAEPYTRFSAARFTTAETTPKPPAPPSTGAEQPVQVSEPPPSPAPQPAAAPGLPSAPDDGFQAWNDLLDWCMEAGDAQFVFVMNQEGFVVSEVGEMPHDEIEGIGSQLTVTMSSVEDMGSAGKPRTLILEFDEFWLTSIRFPGEAAPEVLLGMASSAPLAVTQSEGIIEVFQRSLKHV